MKAARKAFEKWSALPGAERAKYLFRIARIIQERSRELAVLETLDNGKPIKETRDADLPLVAAHFFYYAGWADKLDHAGLRREPAPAGRRRPGHPLELPAADAGVEDRPGAGDRQHGGAEARRDDPALRAVLRGHLPPGRACPRASSTSFPGYGDAGAALVAHPDVNKVAFTGSTAVGKAIARTVAGTDKKVTLELGGKGANIVFDDAPIDQAVEGIVNGIFFNQGQVCCAGSPPARPGVGPGRAAGRPSSAGCPRCASATRWTRTPTSARSTPPSSSPGSPRSSSTGEAEGAERWSPACELPSSGYWFAPTLFTDVTQAHTVARDEIFGPVLSVLTFRTPDEAVAKANNTPYGLSAGIWTEKGSRILAVASKLRAGVIWANTFNKFDPTSPFGGYKESGFGREGGRHGLEAYLDV